MKSLVGLASLAAVAFAAPAMADSINFAQFGPTGTSVSNGATGVTAGGVSFTITDPSAGFTEYCEDKARECGGGVDTWAGEFFKDEVILFNNEDPSPVTITFATPVTSIQDLQAQANAYGAFTETLNAYSGTTLVATDSADWFNSVSDPTYGEGTIPVLNVSGLDITSITISTTNDGGGFALGGTGGAGNPIGGGVPEPATWALLLVGFAGLGVSLRGRRRGLA